MPSGALCFSIHPLTIFSPPAPESTEGIPQGSVLVTQFLACTIINRALAGAVTVENWEWSVRGSPHPVRPFLGKCKWATSYCFDLIRLSVCGLWDKKSKQSKNHKSFNLSGVIFRKTKEHLKRTEGSPCQACGVMIYLGKFCRQFNFATCHLCWIRGCLKGGWRATLGDRDALQAKQRGLI